MLIARGEPLAAKKKASGVNKSAFIRGALESNPKATLAEIQAAWTAEGHAGDLNSTLVYQVKSKLGLGARRKKRRGPKPAGVVGEPQVFEKGYLQIERQLDGLIADAQELKDTKLVARLREARRYASAKLL